MSDSFCDPIDCSPPGSSVHGISLARILEWIAIFFPRGSSRPRHGTCIFCVGRFFTTKPPGKPSELMKWSEVTQSCLTLCNPMDCSLSRSSIYGIFQARVLEWGAIVMSRLVKTFHPRNKRLLISGLQPISAVILETPPPVKSVTVAIVSWIYLPWSEGTRCHDLTFLNVEF